MSKVDIIRKHIGSDNFYDLNGTEMLSKILAAMEEYSQEQVKNLTIPRVSGSSFDWDKFAKALDDKFGESLISVDDADENNPYDYWLQDVTVADIVEFCKNYR